MIQPGFLTYQVANRSHLAGGKTWIVSVIGLGSVEDASHLNIATFRPNQEAHVTQKEPVG